MVPARVDAPAKQGLIDLVDHAVANGFSARWACRVLGIDHARVLSWRARQAAGADLADQAPGPVPGEAVHALLGWEVEEIIEIAKAWEQVDLSHRKLAHRGSYLEKVFVSESTVLRVLTEAGMRLPGLPARPPRPRTPWPQWAELTPGVIYIYDI